jgi:hypothetical protein
MAICVLLVLAPGVAYRQSSPVPVNPDRLRLWMPVQAAFSMLCGFSLMAVVQLVRGARQSRQPRRTIFLAFLVIALVVLATQFFVPARLGFSRNSCTAYLLMIQQVKETWAADHQKSPTSTPLDSDLFGSQRYFIRRPVCPAGGIYQWGKVNEKPTCSLDRQHRSPPEEHTFVSKGLIPFLCGLGPFAAVLFLPTAFRSASSRKPSCEAQP